MIDFGTSSRFLIQAMGVYGPRAATLMFSKVLRVLCRFWLQNRKFYHQKSRNQELSSLFVVFKNVGLHRHRGRQRSRQHDHSQHVVPRGHEEGPDPHVSASVFTLVGPGRD